MTRTYRAPEEATAPRDLVRIDRILIDGGEQDVSIARGAWDGKPSLLIRWNGHAGQPKGYPAQYDNLLWRVVPDWMNAGVLRAVADRIGWDLVNSERDIPPGKTP